MPPLCLFLRYNYNLHICRWYLLVYRGIIKCVVNAIAVWMRVTPESGVVVGECILAWKMWTTGCAVQSCHCCIRAMNPYDHVCLAPRSLAVTLHHEIWIDITGSCSDGNYQRRIPINSEPSMMKQHLFCQPLQHNTLNRWLSVVVNYGDCIS